MTATEPDAPATQERTFVPRITGPLAALHVSRLCVRDHFRFDFSQVRVGRDANGCFALATDSYGIALAQWDAADTDSLGMWEAAIDGVATASLLPVMAEASVKEFVAEPNRLTVRLRKTSTLTIGCDEPGRFPPPDTTYGVVMTAVVDDGSALDVAPDLLAQVAGILAEFSGIDRLPARYYRAKPTKVDHLMHCWKTDPDPMNRNLRVWVGAMPTIRD